MRRADHGITCSLFQSKLHVGRGAKNITLSSFVTSKLLPVPLTKRTLFLEGGQRSRSAQIIAMD